ncbi:methyl-accepting chemotaxis protein [Tumebacillus sp. ITR2]|uniref:Methyl-accepting chemotaxis protein n=1 Tax=Tumebacillus amylolyticus TaxID=2801339 RepID=A0ABS1JAH8_9BACL|nr:HAMP domain-containing methyl-accepting chemotaxis protein [Tumebacillus amylolyticus]MBL0387282.1 methyl-accepting chemotaxis protein [Tumebacillus amylolyticus]
MKFTIRRKLLAGYFIVAFLIVVIGVGSTEGFLQIASTAEAGGDVAPLIHQNIVITATLCIVTLVLLVVIGSVLARIIVKPIRVVSKRIDHIALGDLTAEEIQLKNRDEIGDLAASINVMTRTLRGLIGEVEGAAVQVASSAEQLYASAQQSAHAAEHSAVIMQELADGTDKQVRSIEETDQTVRELTLGIQQIAASSQGVTSISIQASAVAQEGTDSIQKAIQQMHSISAGVSISAENIQNLSEQAKNIGQIVATIEGLSSQTNLLALNAAIEAARAGEHGRGFAVVADEVRKLAEQSTHSAHRIAEYIHSIQNEIQKAVDAMKQGTEEVTVGIQVVHDAGTSFEKIKGVVAEVSTQIQEVSAAVQQMSAGADQVLHSVDTIKVVTEQTAEATQSVSVSSEQQLASMQEITASSSSLAEMAELLDGMIKKFKV